MSARPAIVDASWTCGIQRSRQFCEAEVQDLDEAVWPAHHVLWLEIAMHHARSVCRRQRGRDLDRDVESRAQREMSRQRVPNASPSTYSIAMNCWPSGVSPSE
jgi:hypothetical protein